MIMQRKKDKNQQLIQLFHFIWIFLMLSIGCSERKKEIDRLLIYNANDTSVHWPLGIDENEIREIYEPCIITHKTDLYRVANLIEHLNEQDNLESYANPILICEIVWSNGSKDVLSYTGIEFLLEGTAYQPDSTLIIMLFNQCPEVNLK